MTDPTTAKGTFEVQLTPSEPPEAPVARLLIAKTFQGELEARSVGQMLSIGTEVKGSAAYVALEVVDGTLAGRRGTFARQHRGTMDRGAPDLDLRVVPDSGTGELRGLTGSMRIIIEDGEHRYELDWALAPR